MINAVAYRRQDQNNGNMAQIHTANFPNLKVFQITDINCLKIHEHIIKDKRHSPVVFISKSFPFYAVCKTLKM